MNNIPTYFVVVSDMYGESNSFLHPFFIILVVVTIAFLWPVELNAVRGLIHVHFTRLKVKCLFHHADQLNEEEPREEERVLRERTSSELTNSLTRTVTKKKEIPNTLQPSRKTPTALREFFQTVAWAIIAMTNSGNCSNLNYMTPTDPWESNHYASLHRTVSKVSGNKLQ